jgi:hypothetical protein
VLPAGWTQVAALAAAFAVAVLATPAGVSGAVLLLPFQVSVLGTPSPAVTPTNLLYNVVATPGALYRYRRQGQTGGRLTLILIASTLPGVIAGSVIRVELLLGPRNALLREPSSSHPGRQEQPGGPPADGKDMDWVSGKNNDPADRPAGTRSLDARLGTNRGPVRCR